jgi:hypothetical protein
MKEETMTLRTLTWGSIMAVGTVALAACTANTTTGTDVSRSMPSIQEQACLAAVSNETSNGDVTVLSSEFSEANTVVMIGVGDNRAPWRCLVSNDGVVAEVMSMVDEGAA